MADKSPAELLGYYLIIFQTTFTGYVKCWIDGNDNYTYMSEEGFIDLFRKVNADFNLIIEAKDCLCTSSIYLWIIDEGKIIRLSAKPERRSLQEYLNNNRPKNNKRKSEEMTIWGTFLSKMLGKDIPRDPKDT